MYTYPVYPRVVIRSVRLSRRAEESLKHLPDHVVRKLLAWVDAVEHEGLEEVRRIPGYHDEPLHGVWRGHRSIRLSRAYRGIYRIAWDGELEIAVVEEVNKHEY